MKTFPCTYVLSFFSKNTKNSYILIIHNKKKVEKKKGKIPKNVIIQSSV